jgi:ubiquinone/menaquinone biosynthesis C-methylase UbiE
MGIYCERILPVLIDAAMRQKTLGPYRQRVVGSAAGRVLEVGVGSGRNLPFYLQAAEEVIALDPSPKLLSMARAASAGASVRVRFLAGSAEEIPLPSKSVDTVLTTWTLCTIPDAVRALGEMRRVLKPGGRLLFVEHGQSPDRSVRRWQDRLTPVWRRIGGGCHLNRPIGALIVGSGFHLDRLETAYMRGPSPMTYMYEGAARAN